ncbi:MAG: hypothetical protein ACQBVK_04330 [Candidatus Phytoplasma sp. TWB_XP]
MQKRKTNQIVLIFMIFTYVGFITTNLITLFFDFKMRIKANVIVSLCHDVSAVAFSVLKKKENNKLIKLI